MMADARRKGVSGVPYTVIQNKYAVGGVTAETYIQVCPVSDFIVRCPS